MATSFAATSKVTAFNLGYRLKIGVYSLQMPSSFTGAGEAWDLSSDFTEVYGAIINCGDAVTDGGWKFSLFGTAGTYGMTASTIKVAAHRDAGSATVFAAANTDDISGVSAIRAIVFGYK